MADSHLAPVIREKVTQLLVRAEELMNASFSAFGDARGSVLGRAREIRDEAHALDPMHHSDNWWRVNGL